MAGGGFTMSYQERLEQLTIAISTSESADMAALGLSNEHLRDAMTEIARHMLALGAKLIYGGDLRQYGFSELLFELVARYRRDAHDVDEQADVINYLAWPVHICKEFNDIKQLADELAGSAELVCLALDGTRISTQERQKLSSHPPSEADWSTGLTAMRHVTVAETHARIVLGGRVEHYKGAMPGIAEEVLLSLQERRPLFLLGGFGGCARDIAETLGLIAPWAPNQSDWQSRDAFKAFTATDLNNGLTPEENATLASTPHIDQAIILILRGLLKTTTKKQ